MKFSQKLKRLRQEKNWSQEILAGEIGVKRLAVVKYEGDQTKPSAKTLQKISSVFGVSIDYLLAEEPEQYSVTEIKDKTLAEYVSEIEQMGEAEINLVKFFLDAVIFRHKHGSD
ncbi:MAG: helix-turn-helix transcriptional regulator [Bacillota bacterium]|jgi:transcriptional regulator with XRE-family HTH domain